MGFLFIKEIVFRIIYFKGTQKKAAMD